MTKEELINHIDRIRNVIAQNPPGGIIQAKQFVKTYIGADTHFSKSIDKISPDTYHDSIRADGNAILNSLKDYIENGLHRTMSYEREIQLETVSDYLEQAEKLLNDKIVHPAAAAVIIGASLEEFLRNWLEESGFDITSIKNSLDAYAKELKTLDKINKQDIKDLTSWGGTRNDAAHGHWQNVEDRQRIKLMLEGVNLFIRKYST
ncbi:hypothetical protein [Flavobacterium sp. LB2P74]|uniref:hypothetical protein n=1 Tax=Flavobacterium sp. LB2P74 TaxID=3401717 RepID=UPI003AAB79D7